MNSTPDAGQVARGSAATNKNLALVAMIFAVSMTFIDQTIVSIAVPSLQKDLSLSESGVQWIVNSYLVALAALFALGGRLSDILGHKRVVLIGVVLFAVASGMVGATPTNSLGEAWIIVWRALQGVGAAFLFPASLAIVVAAFPRAERGKAMATFFGIAGGMTALGPLVGGYLIEVSWRAIFWINIPVAVVAVVLTVLAKPDDTRRPSPLDIRGAILAAAGIGLLVLGLQQASTWGWDSVATIGAIVVGLGLIVAFVLAELAAEHPLMQVRIFSGRGFQADALVLFLISIAFVPMFLFASMYAQISLEFSASNAGLYIGIFFLGFVAAAQLGGRILDARGAKASVVVGTIVATVGYVLWAQSMTDLSTAADWGQWWRMAIAGAGTGLVLGPISTDALNRAPHSSYGEVTGITQTCRNIGASVGIAIFGTMMIALNKTNVTDEFEKLGVPKAEAEKVASDMSTMGGGSHGGSLGSGEKAREYLHAVQTSFAHSVETVFYGMAIAMALAAVVALVWLPGGKVPDAEIVE